MTRLREFTTALAGGVMLLAACSSAMAIDIGDRNGGLGVSVDVGRDGVDVGATVGDRNSGINADASVGLGGSSAVDVDATASIGGAVTVDADATVGGSNVADVDADIGLGGTNVDVDVSVGPGVDIDVGIGGPDGPGGPTVNNPNNPRPPGTTGPRPGRPAVTPPARNVPGVIANMTNSDIIKYRKLCRQAQNAGGFDDPAIAQLCRLLQMASR